MARMKGAVNYKNSILILIDIVEKMLPSGSYHAWQAVAIAYQELSKEQAVSDGSDMGEETV